MSFIFLRNRVTGGAAFSPASLFASGEEGAWYEPSPATCFTDTAGTTAAGVGDPVARINDSSGNGNHATQASSTARPLLQQTAGGLYYLAFDGAEDIIRVAYGSTFANITRGVAYQSDGQYFIYDDNDTVNAAALYSSADGDLRWGVNDSIDANAIFGTGGWGRGAPEIAVATASSSQEITLAGSGNSASGTAVSAPAGITGVTLGAAANDSFKMSGRIYTFVDVDRVITAEENTNLQTYLAAKSGVTL